MSDKLKAKLEALAANEDEDEETRQWALDVLSGKDSLVEEPKPAPHADGGEGRNAPPPKESPSESFNEWIREARHPGSRLPAHLRWMP
jgi:hypothetical protein